MSKCENYNQMKYALRIAQAASTMSPDPRRKVGAVAMTPEGRIIATGYNGLRPGFDIPEAEHDAWWSKDDNRRQFVLHAEENLCSLFIRGQVELVATTTAPCLSCARILVAHGVKLVCYDDTYETDIRGLEYLKTCNIPAIQLFA